jgi:hypothetical protein
MRFAFQSYIFQLMSLYGSHDSPGFLSMLAKEAKSR